MVSQLGEIWDAVGSTMLSFLAVWAFIVGVGFFLWIRDARQKKQILPKLPQLQYLVITFMLFGILVDNFYGHLQISGFIRYSKKIFNAIVCSKFHF